MSKAIREGIARMTYYQASAVDYWALPLPVVVARYSDFVRIHSDETKFRVKIAGLKLAKG